MPTGYTSEVQEGKISFENFVLKCARQFGACASQRDDDISTKPKKIQVSSHHKTELVRAKNKLKALKSKSNKALQEEFDKTIKDGIRNAQNELKNTIIETENYKKMLTQVENWQPPSPDHENLKKFMTDQLKSSLEFDDMKDYYTRDMISLQSETFVSWRTQIFDSAKKDVKYHEEALQKEINNVKKQNKWIDQLYSSL